MGRCFTSAFFGATLGYGIGYAFGRVRSRLRSPSRFSPLVGNSGAKRSGAIMCMFFGILGTLRC